MNPSIAARMERLPLCGFHRRFMAVVCVGAWSYFFDLFVTAYLGAALQNIHFLTLQQFAYLIAAGFLGMFIGTIAQGVGSDYFGRRPAFITMLLLYSLFSILSAFAPNAATLIALRFLVGLGIGGQQVVVDTYTSEMVPTRVRGRYVAISQLVGFTAVPIGALLTSLLVPTNFLLAGWRWVMILGGSGAFFSWFIMRRIKESPRWLESRGRHLEAEKAMEQIEAEVRRDTGKPLLEPSVVPVEVTLRMPFEELWKPPYRSRTIMLCVFNLLQTVGFYGFANWAPTFLLHEGRNIGQSLNFSFLFALMNPVGPLIGVCTTEFFERKRAIVMLSLLIASTGMVFAYAKSTVAIVAIGAIMTVFTSWFSSVFHAYQAELFPTRARATGVGFTFSWSRLSAVFSTLIIGALLVHGILAVFIFIALAMVGVALVVGLFGPRTNAVVLEEISR
jgi:MFS transporter, putative metabolite:H+ symporter